jgi:hypothetical protein
MWLLGLVMPLYLYVQPFLVGELVGPAWCPYDFGACFDSSTHGPHPHAVVLAVPLLLGGLLMPIAWHRRSLARLCRHTRAVVDPGQPGRYREAPGTVLRAAIPELAARSAVLRYAGRLALALALLLPVYFVAWDQASIILGWPCLLRPRVLPCPADYVPLLALSTLLVAFHVPTRRRVLGGLAGSWGGSGTR